MLVKVLLNQSPWNLAAHKCVQQSLSNCPRVLGIASSIFAIEKMHGTTSTSHEPPGRRSQKCSAARMTKKQRERGAAEEAYRPDEMRPWKYIIPTMNDILRDDDWPLQVHTFHSPPLPLIQITKSHSHLNSFVDALEVQQKEDVILCRKPHSWF
jgi:hypothetical protein